MVNNDQEKKLHAKNIRNMNLYEYMNCRERYIINDFYGMGESMQVLVIYAIHGSNSVSQIFNICLQNC